MQIESFYHLTQNQYCYIENTNLIIKVRCKKNDAKKVYIKIGDPYLWEQGGGGGNLVNEDAYGWTGGKIFEMEKEWSTQYFDYYKITITPDFGRSRYAFIFENSTSKYLYGEKKIIQIEDFTSSHLSDQGNFFCFPFLFESEAFKAPSWVKDTIWYHIFVDRFHNSKPSISPKNVEAWGSEPTYYNYTGGDLYGVYEKLDYIKDLGISGIYLSPIFEANTNHKYDTVNYYKIDPYFGDLEICKKIVKKAHELNIKVMIDIVFNHISDKSEMWLDVIKNETKSKYYDWFRIRKFPLIENSKLNYDAFGFSENMPKVNFENKEAFTYFLEVAKYWLKECDFDAYRLDVANEVPHKFWKSFNYELTKIKKDFYILGEIWHDATPWLNNDELHGVMNYPLGDAICKYFATNEITKEEFQESYSSAMCAYPHTINQNLYNLLGSHDTSRILSRCQNNKNHLKQAMLFMFMQPGCPSIYYGDEIGIIGDGDVANRKCMTFDVQDIALRSFYQDLTYLRNTQISTKSCNIKFLNTEYLSFQKDDLIVILNENSIDNLDLNQYDILMGNLVNNTLEAQSYLVLKEKNTL